MEEAQQVKADCCRFIILQIHLCPFWFLSHRRSLGPNGANNSPQSYFIIFDFNRHPEGSAPVGMPMLYGAVIKKEARKVSK